MNKTIPGTLCVRTGGTCVNSEVTTHWKVRSLDQGETKHSQKHSENRLKHTSSSLYYFVFCLLENNSKVHYTVSVFCLHGLGSALQRTTENYRAPSIADPGNGLKSPKVIPSWKRRAVLLQERELTGSKDTSLVEKQVEGKVSLPFYKENSFTTRF